MRAMQETRIRLVYMQAADIDNSMGRYVYPLEEGETDNQANAFWSYDPVVKEDFSFNVNLRSGYPVDGVRLPQHPQAIVSQTSQQEWLVNMGNKQAVVNPAKTESELEPKQAENTGTLAEDIVRKLSKMKPISNAEIAAMEASESGITVTSSASAAMTLDKDIVMYWRLAPNLPGSIDLVTHREPGAKRGTFMMTLTPGDDLAQITEGRDWAFVLDMSGSMSGKYATMVDGVQRALNGLNPEDRFQIILFDNAVMDLTQSWVLTSHS